METGLQSTGTAPGKSALKGGAGLMSLTGLRGTAHTPPGSSGANLSQVLTVPLSTPVLFWEVDGRWPKKAFLQIFNFSDYKLIHIHRENMKSRSKEVRESHPPLHLPELC